VVVVVVVGVLGVCVPYRGTPDAPRLGGPVVACSAGAYALAPRASWPGHRPALPSRLASSHRLQAQRPQAHRACPGRAAPAPCPKMASSAAAAAALAALADTAVPGIDKYLLLRDLQQ
jgi:hypothetical protein